MSIPELTRRGLRLISRGLFPLPLALMCSCSSSTPAVPELVQGVPDTPVGRALAANVLALSEGRADPFRTFAEEWFAPSLQGEFAEASAKQVERFHQIFGGFESLFWLPSTDEHASALLQIQGRDQWRRLDVAVDPQGKIVLTDLQHLIPAIGQAAPHLIVEDRWLQGGPIPEFEKGRIYVLDFWATWCQPCLELIPKLNALSAKYDDITVIGVATLPQANMRNLVDFLREAGDDLSYPVVDDGLLKIAQRYGITKVGLPSTVVVDAEGRIAWSWAGSDAPVEEVIRRLRSGEYSVERLAP